MKQFFSITLLIFTITHASAQSTDDISGKIIALKRTNICSNLNFHADHQNEAIRLHDIWFKQVKEILPFFKAQAQTKLTPAEKSYSNNDDFMLGRLVGNFGAYGMLETMQLMNKEQTNPTISPKIIAENLIKTNGCNDIK